MGYKVGLIPEAYVYHKRRTTVRQFYRQVFRFGAARVNLFKRHREELKITHLFPVAFFLGFMLMIISGLLVPLSMFPFIVLWPLYDLYLLAILVHSTILNRSLLVGFLSIITAIVQLCGYGIGFLANFWEVFVKGNPKGIKAIN
jgi:GT2 family glycosyltransferase